MTASHLTYTPLRLSLHFAVQVSLLLRLQLIGQGTLQATWQLIWQAP